MAEYKIIQKLDEKLIAERILDPAFRNDYRKVHTKLNSQFKKSGAVLAEKTFKRGDATLRKWLIELYQKGASQDKLTSYLRCGLAHLSFDYIESSYKSIDKDDLVTRAMLSFKKRDFHKTFFKAAESASPVKKKKAVKKKTVKPVRKKTAQSKAKVKKKPAVKAVKKTVKKTKPVNKRTSGEKDQNKKKSAKKKRLLKIKLFK